MHHKDKIQTIQVKSNIKYKILDGDGGYLLELLIRY